MPSNPRSRALVLALIVVSVCAVVGLAATSTGAAPTPANAALKLRAGTHLKAGKRVVTVPGAKIVLKGSVTPFSDGDRVLIKADTRGVKAKRKIKTVTGTPGKSADYTLGLKLRKRGKWTITAQRVDGNGKPFGDRARARVWVVMAHAGYGSHGLGVRALQSRLRKLGYIAPSSGSYDGTTGRAVLAFRKVNRMARVESANRAVFRKLAGGGGAFKLRYPKAGKHGKHVEFDWTRQVVVFAIHGKPKWTITTSSGAPATPTSFGKFRFWLKQAGYNQKQMYYSTYFHNGQAIHGFASVPNQPASHGCLRIPIANAIRVYNWLDFGDIIYTYR